MEINPFVYLEKASVEEIVKVVTTFYGEDVDKIFSGKRSYNFQ